MPKEGWKSKKRRSWPEGHRACTKCHQVLPFSQFNKAKAMLFGISTQCKKCQRFRAIQQHQETSVEYKLLCGARYRAKVKGLECTITEDDIKIPDTCPVFGYKMIYNSATAPSLDRIDSSKGYTPDNIQVISKRANALKNDASLEEIKKLYEFMCEIL